MPGSVASGTHCILCFRWIIKCLIIIDARCKHEDQLILFSAVIAVCFESGAEHLNARDGITLSV